jgi:hypothetical protein
MSEGDSPKQNFHLIQRFLSICNAWFTLLREEVFSGFDAKERRRSSVLRIPHT